jgi:hypothetical protein
MPQALADRSLLAAAAIGAGLGVVWLVLGSIGWVVVGAALAILLVWYGIAGRWAEMALIAFFTGGVPLPFLATQAAASGMAREELIRHPPFLILGGAAILAALGLVTLVAVAISTRRGARRTARPPHEG